jgi:hypothetical protein
MVVPRVSIVFATKKLVASFLDHSHLQVRLAGEVSLVTIEGAFADRVERMAGIWVSCRSSILSSPRFRSAMSGSSPLTSAVRTVATQFG